MSTYMSLNDNLKIVILIDLLQKKTKVSSFA